MKNLLLVMVALFPMNSVVSESQLAEKGRTRSKSKSETVMHNPHARGSMGPAGPVGPAGPEGPAGPVGPAGIHSPVYATVVQTERFPESGFLNDMEITLPLNHMLGGEGVEFDGANNTLTLPKGIYTMHFQFTLMANDDTGGGPQWWERFFFNEMYVDLNDGDFKIYFDWVSTIEHSLTNKFRQASFAGSEMFPVYSDNTKIKLVLKRPYTGDIAFSFDPTPLKNNLVRITLHKIA